MIYSLAGDTIGDTVSLLKEAAVLAIETGRERIDERILAQLRGHRREDWDDAAKRL